MLQVSLERAYDFLKKNLNQDGLWSDFLTLAGESVCWVSGYIGSALYDYYKMRGESWLERVGEIILKHREREGGWGYGPGVPADADSTSWCLLFLSRIGVLNQEHFDEALDFLLSHQSSLDGGFRTYRSPIKVREYMGLDESVSFEGWCSSQNCVTSVAAQVLMENQFSDVVDDAIDFIKKNQAKGGYWEPYWWSERTYATYHCMKALKDNDERVNAEALGRAQGWLAEAQLMDGGWGESTLNGGSPFSAALALKALLLQRESRFSSEIDKAIEWLLSQQQADGSWVSHYILRIPHPSVREPWKQDNWRRDGKAINAVIRDHNRLFSTATVFSALWDFVETL